MPPPTCTGTSPAATEIPRTSLNVDPSSCKRAIQIHDVNAARAQPRPALRHRYRIVSVHRCGLLHALSKLYATPALNVDGGNQDQSVPLVDGKSWLRESRASAMRNARPNALNIVSAWWCAFAPFRLSMCRVTWAWLTNP